MVVVAASLQTRPEERARAYHMAIGPSSARSKVIAPLGQRARLVGEEQLDVSEVLDSHQALD